MVPGLVELVAPGHVECSVSEVKPKAPALSGRLTLSHERRPKLPLLKEHKVVHRRTEFHSSDAGIWGTLVLIPQNRLFGSPLPRGADACVRSAYARGNR